MQVTQTRNGLYVAERSADYLSVQTALRQHDPDLRLVPQPDDDHGCLVWKVYRYAGGDRPAEFVCGWWDEHLTPLPLSHRLVDKVKQLDRNTPGRRPDPDEHNERLKAANNARMDEAVDTALEEARQRHGRLPCFHRGVHLRRARKGL